jgi:hypothetical protein
MVALVVVGGLFWAVGVVLSLICSLLYASRSFVAEDPWLGETPWAKTRWFYQGLPFLLLGLLILLRPGVLWQLIGAVLILGLLAGRLFLLVFERNRLGR